MIETFALGLRLHPDLSVVQREELWASCRLTGPFNSILNLRALWRERGRKAAQARVCLVRSEQAWFFPSIARMYEGALFSGWLVHAYIN